MKKYLITAALVAGSFAGQAFAQAMPAWDQLSASQRDALTAQVESSWNKASPEQRARMMERANKWASMTPEQRAEARKGRAAFGKMSPEARDARRAVYYKVQSMDEAQRRTFLESFRKMTKEQRADWVKANPVPAGAEVKMPQHRGKHMGKGMHRGMKGADKPMTPPAK